MKKLLISIFILLLTVFTSFAQVTTSNKLPKWNLSNQFDGTESPVLNKVTKTSAFIPITCPPGARHENEPCKVAALDSVNGGCNTPPYVYYSTVELGDTICGAAWVDSIPNGTMYRDTDWYLFQLDSYYDFEFTAVSEFNALCFIIDMTDGCGNLTTPYSDTFSGLDTGKMSGTLSPGYYCVWMGASGWSKFYKCASDSLDYWFTISGTPTSAPSFCPVDTPYSSILEDEPCGDDSNGGCNMTTPTFDTVNVGTVIVGNVWFDGSTRDTDWYIFTLTDTTIVTLTAKAEFTGYTGFIDFSSGCPVSSFYSYVYFYPCQFSSLTEKLPPGEWVVWAGSDYSTVIDCDSNVYKLGIFQGPATEIIDNQNVLTSYKLEQNYPNPFNPITNIRFSIPNASNVKLTIYNILGEKVATLVNELKTAGTHQVEFDASYLSSGIYFYRLETPEYIDIKKMILMK
ncbi:MAG: T9SS type A sorting domain-containing protein [Ignavibacteriales bacterium]|nr:T9SS type A sorting domain-containing protein [Ignavibacteriales bacterium]